MQRILGKLNFDRIGTKLWGGNLLVLLVLILVVLGSGINFYRTKVSLNTANHQYVPQITLADTIKETVLKQHVTVQAYIAQPSLETKQEYRDLDRTFEAAYKGISDLAVSSEDKDLIAQVKNEHDNFTMIANNLFNYTDKARSQLVKTLLDNYSVSVTRIVSSSDQLSSRYTAELDKSIKSTDNDLNFALIVMVILTVLSFGGTLVFTIVLTRRITFPMRQLIGVSQQMARGDLRQRVNLQDQGELGLMAFSFNSMVDNLTILIQEVVSASNYIVQVSEDFRKHASDSTLASNTADSVLGSVMESSARQSRNVSSILKSADNVARAISHIDQTIQKVNRDNSHTTSLAEEGKQSVNEGSRQMEVIRQTMGYLAGNVGELTGYVSEISHIIDVMENFTAQTNMLALNAAIEANRVGEQGKGFAVVANEIRKLADESSKALEKIRKVTDTIQSKSEDTAKTMEESQGVVKSGSQAMQTLSLALNQIVNYIHNSVGQFKELGGASSDISTHSKLIVQDIKDLQSISRETVENSETLGQVINLQTRAVMEAAASLSEIAVALEQSAGKFALVKASKGDK